ncbi:MAG: fasciclin domain-containing protein [Planctomycetota bacterium]
MNSISVRTLAATLAISLSLTANAAAQCEATKPAAAPSDQVPNIVEAASAAGSFTTLLAAAKAAGLAEALQGEGPFTVFAPTDDAFAKLPAGTIDKLLEPANRAKLAAILKLHVVPARMTAKSVATSAFANTLLGQRVRFTKNDQGVFVGDAKVIVADVMGSNGVIHGIDSVLLPVDKTIVQTAQAAGSFKTLLAAATAAGLAEVLASEGPWTVFAPSDEAFGKLPAGTVDSLLEPGNRDQLIRILKLHVVSGRVYSDQAAKAGSASSLAALPLSFEQRDGLRVNGAKIVATDIENSNGVVHVIDTVLLPK